MKCALIIGITGQDRSYLAEGKRVCWVKNTVRSRESRVQGPEAVMRMREEYWKSGLRVTDEEAGLNCTAICCTVGW